MSVEMLIGAGIVVLLVAIAIKHRPKSVPMDHKAPNVHNEVMPGKVGPATAADKPAAPAKKKAPAKKTAKKTTKKTAKKTAAKK